MNELRRYLRFFGMAWLTSLKASLEFRFNIALHVLVGVLFYVGQALVFETLYQHMDRIGDWTLPQMRVFLGLFFLGDGLFGAVFRTGLETFPQKIRKGDLDLELAKPINSQFLVSFSRFSISDLLQFLICIPWVVWATQKVDPALHPNWWVLILTVPLAVMATYSLRFILSTINVYFHQAENIAYLFWGFYRLGSRPDFIYHWSLRWIIWTLIPVAFTASIPAQLIFGDLPLKILCWVFAWTGFLFWFSIWFWKRAIRHYTSASS